MVWEEEDHIDLIILIQGIFCHFNVQQQATWSVVHTKKRVFLLIQSEHVSIEKYYEEFKESVAIIETYGGTLVELSMIKNELILVSVDVQQDTNGE